MTDAIANNGIPIISVCFHARYAFKIYRICQFINKINNKLYNYYYHQHLQNRRIFS